jgi:hypothetical protein
MPKFIDDLPLCEPGMPQQPALHGTGYEGPRPDLSGKLKCSRPFSVPVIPTTSMKDLILQKDQNKTWLTDLCDQMGVTVKDQDGSSYCWIHAPTHGMEVCYCQQGVKLVLSAFYPGAQIKNGRNQGGSGVEGGEWLSEHGTCIEKFHAPDDFSTRTTPELLADAQLHKIIASEEPDSGDHASIISAVLSNVGVSVGIPAWSHEVLIVRIKYQPGARTIPGFPDFVYVIDNSWSTGWGSNGRGALSAVYSRFDEAFCVREASPAEQES